MSKVTLGRVKTPDVFTALHIQITIENVAELKHLWLCLNSSKQDLINCNGRANLDMDGISWDTNNELFRVLDAELIKLGLIEDD